MQALQLEQKSSPSSSSADTVLLSIPPDEVGRIWGVAGPLLEKAIAYTSKVTTEEFREMCELGSCQLWMVYYVDEDEIPAAIVTDIQVGRNGTRIARMIGCGGTDMARWKEMALTQLEEWARSESCTSMEIVGRKGWGRACPEYQLIEHVYSKEL